MLESAYEECISHELNRRRLSYTRQIELPVVYKGVRLDCGYRMDVVVEDWVVVESKAIEQVLPVHEAQLLTYLRLSGKRIDLIIDFNTAMLRNGIIRRVL